MTDDSGLTHVRRPRYRGTHPRDFGDKYKELNPARYAADVAKVIAAGKTPAGMHRPIMVAEILEVLAPAPGELAVDATVGFGGHAARLLHAIQPGGRLLALDVDPVELPKTEARLRAGNTPPEALIVRRSNFAGLGRALAAEQLPAADLLLADLGLSSMQMDDPSRGFTFKRTGPLDLRMNPQRGQPASALLAALDATALADMLAINADQPDALTLARALIDRQRSAPLSTTTALAEAVREAVRQTGRAREDDEQDASVRRVFQALRVAVNDEFGALDALLRQLPDCMQSGGRIAILAFHSGEDRRVKHAFREGARVGIYSRICEGVIRASPYERHANPRSSSAKLRWAVRA